MPIQINISNATCQVQNSTSEISRILRQELSYTDRNVEFSLLKNIKEIKRINTLLDSKGGFALDRQALERQLGRLLHINRGLERKLTISLYQNDEFPTGLLPRAITILSDLGHEIKLNDKRIKPKLKEHRFVLKQPLPALRYYQKTSVRKLEEEGRGIVVMPTGTGKTVTIAKMIWELGLTTLIVTPSKAITDMMLEVMIKHFGKGKVEKLTTKTKVIKKPINIINIQALIKCDPAVFVNVDSVFIDEFHHSAADTYREVNLKHLKNVYFRLGFTATNFRNDGADLALESVLSHVLYTYEIQQAISDGYLIKPTFEIVDIEVPDANTYQKAYKQSIVENDERNELIAEIAEHHSDDQVLILVQQIEHGERLKSIIPGSEFIHGEEKDLIRQRMLDDFRSGKLKCLIGSTVIGEGVDIPNANVLIMAGGGKAKSQIMQNIGRVLRIHPGKTEALVYDFTDRGCEWLEEHSNLRQEIYEQY